MKLGELRPAAEKVARKRVGRGIGSGTGKIDVYQKEDSQTFMLTTTQK